jgi:hypothetical protein
LTVIEEFLTQTRIPLLDFRCFRPRLFIVSKIKHHFPKFGIYFWKRSGVPGRWLSVYARFGEQWRAPIVLFRNPVIWAELFLTRDKKPEVKIGMLVHSFVYCFSVRFFHPLIVSFFWFCVCTKDISVYKQSDIFVCIPISRSVLCVYWYHNGDNSDLMRRCPVKGNSVFEKFK